MSLYRPKLKALCGCLVVEVTMVMQMLSDASCRYLCDQLSHCMVQEGIVFLNVTLCGNPKG